MNRSKVGLVATLVLIALAPASALAHEFVASKAGTVKGKQVNVQKFETSGGILECKKDASEGSVVAGSQKTIVLKIQFLECTEFGFGVFASIAEMAFNAEGTATIMNLVEFEVPLAECEITLPTTSNSNLKVVMYKNLAGGKLEIKSVLKPLNYGTTGGTCGASGKNGAYAGNNEVELPGGTLEWK